MKKLTSCMFIGLGMLGTSYAGHQVAATNKEYKAPMEVTCFGDREWQFDLYGAYVDGNSPNHAGPIKDHGWGGGVGINYFFSRILGIGVDATWIYARTNGATPGADTSDQTIFHNFSGSLIARFPNDSTCLAPYLFIGGGFHVDGEQWASAHAGFGIEYRVVPNRVGLFADARWTYFGDRFDHQDQNNFMGKAGVRFAF